MKSAVICHHRPYHRSLPAWGAWIEINVADLKLALTESLPAWGAWIEIGGKDSCVILDLSLPAWGAWIEIQAQVWYKTDHDRRSPHGERGLK